MKIRPTALLLHTIWLAYVAVLGWIKFAHHELWKDEWQAWFVAKDMGIFRLFSFLYYEGHPALWYLYLKLFVPFPGWTDISPEYIIQGAHLITVAVGLYFLIVRFHLPLILKILFASGYFLFFEYGMISRGYFLVILLAFWITELLCKEHYDRRLIGILLVLLCQTEVYGVFMALAFGLYILMKSFQDKTDLISSEMKYLSLGLFLFILSVFPRTYGHIARTQSEKLSTTDKFLNTIQGNLSNTFCIGSTPDTAAYGWTMSGIIISIAAFVALVFLYRQKKRIWLTGLFFLVMVISFGFLFFTGGVRQWGMGFIFLIILEVLYKRDYKSDLTAVVILLIFNAFCITHSFKAVKAHFEIPFTNAATTGRFIKESVPEKVPVVAINKFEATPVIGYAGRSFYELPDGVPFTYFRWVDRIYLPTENELRLFTKFKKVGGIIVITPKLLDTDRYPTAKLWKSFDDKNYKNENYYLYTLALNPSG
ncbi:MAG: hypothetical protein IPM42_05885 [Saprospiraceae bacterium]|nr:hypothetical protein [Saprospiraceae bacterium]